MSTVWHVLALPLRAIVLLADLAMMLFRIGILLWLMVMGAIVLVLLGVRMRARLRAWHRALTVFRTHATSFGIEQVIISRHGRDGRGLDERFLDDAELDREDLVLSADTPHELVFAAGSVPGPVVSGGW